MTILEMVGVFFSGLTKANKETKTDVKQVKNAVEHNKKELDDIKAELKRSREQADKKNTYSKGKQR